MAVLDRKLITRMVNPQPGGNGGGAGGAGGAGVYVLPAASSSELGGIKLGYPTGTGKYYPVQLDDQQRAYVNVPWTDHYAWGDITGKPTVPTASSTNTGYAANADYAVNAGYASSAGSTDTLSATSYINGTTSKLPHLIWHIPNVSWGNLSMGSDGNFYLRSTNSTSASYANLYANLPDYLAKSGGTITGDLTVNQTFTCQSVEIGHTNEMNATGSSNLYLQYRNNGHLVLCHNGQNVGIGTDSPSYKLHVVGKIYCTGGFAFLSDIRKKNVVGFCNGFSVRDIANAPLIQYTLKGDLDDGRRHIGSVAQYWQKVLPDTVNEADDTLSMDQESILMASVITLARKVMSLENQIIQSKEKANG